MHNGSGFDLPCLLKPLTDNLFIHANKFNEINGKIINLTLENQNCVLFNIRDSCRLLPSSLDDLCKTYQPVHMKKTDHKFQFRDLNWFSIFEPVYRQEISEYLEYDCKSLHEIITKFRQTTWDTKKIDIVTTLTAASIAKRSWK